MTTNDHLPGSRESYERLSDPGIYWTQTNGQPIREPISHRAAELPPAPVPDEGEDPAYDGTHVFRPASTAEQEPTYRRRSQLEEYESRQREHFGGINWGAGFFGWLVAVAMSVLLTGVAGGAVAALSHQVPVVSSMLGGDPRTAALAVAAVLVTVLMTAYYTGGYVAGRMSRFDGGKQGAGVWMTGLLFSALAVGFGLFSGAQVNVLEQVHLPSLSLPPGALGLAGEVAAVVGLLGCLLTAIGGGKVGVKYHQKVDEFP